MSLSDALAQIVHLQKYVIETSYPVLRGALETFVTKYVYFFFTLTFDVYFSEKYII